jgi:hypothetical protein
MDNELRERAQHSTFQHIRADDLARLRARLVSWAVNAKNSGIGGLLSVLLEAASPFSLFGASALWVVQPVAMAILPEPDRDLVPVLARLLTEPDGVAWIRTVLQGAEHMPPQSQPQSEGD